MARSGKAGLPLNNTEIPSFNGLSHAPRVAGTPKRASVYQTERALVSLSPA